MDESILARNLVTAICEFSHCSRFLNSVFVLCYSFVDRIIFVQNFFVFVCCSEATTTMAESP